MRELEGRVPEAELAAQAPEALLQELELVRLARDEHASTETGSSESGLPTWEGRREAKPSRIGIICQDEST